MPSPDEQHYFAATPAAASRQRTVPARLGGREVLLQSDAGVFAASRLDPGTAVLLRAELPVAAGDVLDLGCGYGPIALDVALRGGPAARVWAVDVNARALDLTRRNAGALGVGERVVARAPEDVPADLRLQQIWSNPPIRIGKPALHELLARWLPRLHPDGEAWLVVARNLGADSLAGWLDGQGWPTERWGSRKGYRILRVRPQRRGAF